MSLIFFEGFENKGYLKEYVENKGNNVEIDFFNNDKNGIERRLRNYYIYNYYQRCYFYFKINYPFSNSQKFICGFNFRMSHDLNLNVYIGSNSNWYYNFFSFYNLFGLRFNQHDTKSTKFYIHSCLSNNYDIFYSPFKLWPNKNYFFELDVDFENNYLEIYINTVKVYSGNPSFSLKGSELELKNISFSQEKTNYGITYTYVYIDNIYLISKDNILPNKKLGPIQILNLKPTRTIKTQDFNVIGASAAHLTLDDEYVDDLNSTMVSGYKDSSEIILNKYILFERYDEDWYKENFKPIIYNDCEVKLISDFLPGYEIDQKEFWTVSDPTSSYSTSGYFENFKFTDSNRIVVSSPIVTGSISGANELTYDEVKNTQMILKLNPKSYD